MSLFLSGIVIITGVSAYSLVVIKLWSGFSLSANGLKNVQPEGCRSGVCLRDSRSRGKVASVLRARQNPS